MIIDRKLFGVLSTGEVVNLYKITNHSGFSVSVMDFGATVTEISVPNKNGVFENVVLGFDTFNEYAHSNHCIGATCGRYAGRIKGGRFNLGNEVYPLQVNDGENTLHGGAIGFHKRLWTATLGGDCIELFYLSPDGDQSFPGELLTKVTYRVAEDNELIIEYKALSNKPTVLNLTNHSYFNLTGCVEDVLTHELLINASKYTPSDSGFIPTGEIASIPKLLEFKTSKQIGNSIHEINGFNHNYIIDGEFGEFRFAAELSHFDSGRKMSVYTTEPALMVYTANYLPKVKGKEGKMYDKYYCVCLEAQHFPDSPNNPHFPSTVLLPGEVYLQKTLYKFGAI